MLIDIICLILLVWAVFKGLRNGLILGIFSFLALIIGLAAALKLSALAAAYLGENIDVSERWLPFIAFALVFLVVVFLVRLGAKAIEKILQLALLGWINRIGGILFYALIYLMVFSIILFYVTQLNIIKPETLQASVTYAYLQPLGPKMISALGYLLPWFRDMFSDLQGFFETVSQNANGR
jgi:membrane protein required for colicin V production